MRPIPLISQPQVGVLPEGLLQSLEAKLLDPGDFRTVDTVLLLPEAGAGLLEYFSFGSPRRASRLEQLAALIGKPYQDGTGHCFLVEAVLPIPCAAATGGSVRPSPAEWGEPVRHAVAACNRGRQPEYWSYLLGTAHSHPGFGVFLSGTDKQNHRDMDVELGVSLVLDPMASQLGGFTLQGNRFRRCPVYLAKHRWLGLRVL